MDDACPVVRSYAESRRVTVSRVAGGRVSPVPGIVNPQPDPRCKLPTHKTTGLLQM